MRAISPYHEFIKKKDAINEEYVNNSFIFA
jgi:hypothetical protein